MSTTLAATLRRSERLDEAVATFLGSEHRPADKRQIVVWAHCFAATEHAVAQRILIEKKLTGTALALMRLQYEITLRAAWTHHGADQNWLDKFTSPVPAGSFVEPEDPPKIGKMLKELEHHLPAPNIEQLNSLNSTLKVMHSFVHGGVHSVVHALRGYPDENLASLLINRNLLLWFSCQVFALSTNHPFSAPLRQAFQDVQA